MSEGIIIALIGGGVTILLSVISIVILVITSKNNKSLAIIAAENSLAIAHISANQFRLEASHEKQITAVEQYHKEVNGKMGQLLETTEKLGAERGKAEEKANPTI